MRRLILCLVVLVAVTASGCGETWWSDGSFAVTPRARLVLARKTFAATVNALATARKAGAIPKGSTLEASIDAAIKTADKALDMWEADLILRRLTTRSVEEFNDSMRELTAAGALVKKEPG